MERVLGEMSELRNKAPTWSRGGGGGDDELNEAFAKKTSIVFDAAITDSGIEILYKGDLKDWKVWRLSVSLEGIHWERVK